MQNEWKTQTDLNHFVKLVLQLWFLNFLTFEARKVIFYAHIILNNKNYFKQETKRKNLKTL